MEKSFISLVNVFQVFARKFFAFITKFNLVVKKQFASLLEKSTLLVSRSATLTVRHSHSLSFDIILQSKVTTANSTIHTTRGD